MKLAQAVGGLAPVLLLTACGVASSSAAAAGPTHDPAHGTVTGRMVREGGPIGPGGQQPGLHPIPGTVRFTAGQHRVITVHTSRAGTFSVHLPSGRYQVSDRSPRLLQVGADGIGRQTWSGPVTVLVTADHLTRVTLTSIVP